jgi:FkbM family methyltransferase
MLQWEMRHRRFVTKRFRLWCNDDEVLCVTNRDFEMYASPRDYISHRIFFYQDYNQRLSDLVQYSLRPNFNCWDLGAERGWFSLLMGSIVGPGGRVDSFEPNPESYVRLQGNISLNGFGWVYPHNVAVSDTSDSLYFNMPHTDAAKIASTGLSANGGIGFVSSQRGGGAIEVPSTKLDKFADIQNLTRLDFVKADIEGWELAAFKGGYYTLKEFHPLLLVEYNAVALQRAGASIRELDAFVRSLGYDVFSADSMRPVDIPKVDNGTTQLDVFCIPRFQERP